jgi:hypothetical protein
MHASHINHISTFGNGNLLADRNNQ